MPGLRLNRYPPQRLETWHQIAPSKSKWNSNRLVLLWPFPPYMFSVFEYGLVPWIVEAGVDTKLGAITTFVASLMPASAAILARGFHAKMVQGGAAVITLRNNGAKHVYYDLYILCKFRSIVDSITYLE